MMNSDEFCEHSHSDTSGNVTYFFQLPVPMKTILNTGAQGVATAGKLRQKALQRVSSYLLTHPVARNDDMANVVESFYESQWIGWR